MSCEKCKTINTPDCDKDLCDIELSSDCITVPAIECVGNEGGEKLTEILETICENGGGETPTDCCELGTYTINSVCSEFIGDIETLTATNVVGEACEGEYSNEGLDIITSDFGRGNVSVSFEINSSGEVVNITVNDGEGSFMAGDTLTYTLACGETITFTVASVVEKTLIYKVDVTANFDLETPTYLNVFGARIRTEREALLNAYIPLEAEVEIINGGTYETYWYEEGGSPDVILENYSEGDTKTYKIRVIDNNGNYSELTEVEITEC